MITMKLEGDLMAKKAFLDISMSVVEKKKLIKEVMIPAAKDVVKAMRAIAPKASGVFNVYRTPKQKKGMRAPNGMGKIYVSIKPGQLRKSIMYWRTAASTRAGGINVGPRYRSGVWKKPDKGGWYMHMVQFGTDSVDANPFVLKGLDASRGSAGAKMERLLKERLAEVVTRKGKGIIEFVG
jgi:hypothetical protein